MPCPAATVPTLSVEDDAFFPVALQDAVTAYAYVLNTLNVRPENVVISGDSAGGNLALALLPYMHEEGELVLPHPRAALLWSPWVDLTVDPMLRSVTTKH